MEEDMEEFKVRPQIGGKSALYLQYLCNRTRKQPKVILEMILERMIKKEMVDARWLFEELDIEFQSIQQIADCAPYGGLLFDKYDK